jgi:hypothetical protein
MEMDDVITIVLVTASVSFVVTESALFRGFQRWVQRKSATLHKLLGCYLCLGYWIAFVLSCAFDVQVLPVSMPVVGYVLSALLIGYVSGWLNTLLVMGMAKAGR